MLQTRELSVKSSVLEGWVIWIASEPTSAMQVVENHFQDVQHHVVNFEICGDNQDAQGRVHVFYGGRIRNSRIGRLLRMKLCDEHFD